MGAAFGKNSFFEKVQCQCVYKPRLYGPFNVEEVKGHGNCIVALDDKGRSEKHTWR